MATYTLRRIEHIEVEAETQEEAETKFSNGEGEHVWEVENVYKTLKSIEEDEENAKT